MIYLIIAWAVGFAGHVFIKNYKGRGKRINYFDVSRDVKRFKRIHDNLNNKNSLFK